MYHLLHVDGDVTIQCTEVCDDGYEITLHDKSNGPTPVRLERVMGRDQAQKVYLGFITDSF